ncbi:hypothetical protein [Novipirellula artificiosorum]|uniref:Uncharacterized protein n=1 Tax=Novipirellula artificiosorum TaxID=2528016 RepID=A0A5C6DIT2_9BACT|nr:hypothetical protein [Novipirellula artificiosorum]TWU36125.1 hypothetical protein Poly41_38780 [Novipirellula artificiosorum]
MGGVPVLLLAAAIGVTYGWQPDSGGGVEYIIQVPPEDLQQLQRAGEISSRIDPEVQGHVSRVIIRVGTGPVPRSTPTSISQLHRGLNSPSTVAVQETQLRQALGDCPPYDVLDQAAVPIPEMNHARKANPIPGMNTTAFSGVSTNQIESLMKPDPNDPLAGTGISLPPSLQGTGNSAQDNLMRAANAFGEQAKSTLGFSPNPTNASASIPAASGNASQYSLPPAPTASGAIQTRTGSSNTNNQVPAFTSSNPMAAAASPLAGGPTTDPMTAPSGASASPWYDLNKSSTASSDTTSSMNAARTYQGPPYQGSASGAQAASDLAASNLGATPASSASGSTAGMGTTPTFGRPPTGMMPNAATGQPNWDATAASTSTSMPSTNLQSLQREQYERQQYERQQYERELQQQKLREQEMAQRQALQAQQNSYANLTVPAAAPTTSQQPAQPTGIAPYGSSMGSTFSPPPSSHPTVDPSLPRYLVDALPPGGYSYNHLNQPIDREGRVLNEYGQVVAPAAPRYANNTDSAPSPTVGAPPSYAGAGFATGFPGTQDPPQRAPGTAVRPPQGPLANGGATSSASDQNGNDFSGSKPPPDHLSGTPKTVAAQKLFNGLLLISIVGNLYLIFWLKNLRHQFHDLVAAKRISQVANSSVA